MLDLNKIHEGDWIELSKQLDDESIDMIMTSPPYWGLRDYGVKGQLGLEEHPQQFINNLVKGFMILKKKLKKSGSLYVNLGDTYFGGKGKSSFETEEHLGKRIGQGHTLQKQHQAIKFDRPSDVCKIDGGWLQPKQLMLMPHRFAIAMQDKGWILRNNNIWYKPNPMPCSVKDRLNNTFEFVFHFVKNNKTLYWINVNTGLCVDKKPIKLKEGIDFYYDIVNDKKKKISYWRGIDYFYDLDSIREPHKLNSIQRACRGRSKNDKSMVSGEYSICYSKGHQGYNDLQNKLSNGELRATHPLGKNPGDFWNISTKHFSEAHFAVYPEELCLKPILSSCPRWICKKCGHIRERITKIEYEKTNRTPPPNKGRVVPRNDGNDKAAHLTHDGFIPNLKAEIKTIGWSDCGCNAGFRPGIVLDPFTGAGTTLKVARDNKRDSLGFELNHDYIKIAEKRLFWNHKQLTGFIK